LKKNPPKELKDLLRALSQTSNKNPNLNPLRTKDCDLFTTGQIGIIPKDKKLFYRPIECEIIIKGDEVHPNEVLPRKRDDIDIYVVDDIKEVKELSEMMTFKEFYKHISITKI
jgi:hypothetical protein